MCTKPKMPSVEQANTEVIKTAIKADASVQKANVTNRTNRRGIISENIKTSNTGIEEDVMNSKKKLLGE